MALNNYSLGDINTAVKRQFGDESGVQIVDDDIMRWTNQACMEINSKNKVLRANFATTVPKSGKTTISGDAIPGGALGCNTLLPSNIMTITGVRFSDYTPGQVPFKFNKLTGISYDEWNEKFPLIPPNTGTPIYYTVGPAFQMQGQSDNLIWIGPCPDPGKSADPDQAGYLNIDYVPEPPRLLHLEDTLPLPDRYFDRIIEFVMSKAYELDENWQGLQVQRNLFEDNLSTLSNAETDMEGPFPVIRDVYGDY